MKKLLLTPAVATCGFFVLTAQQPAPPAVFTAPQAAAGRTAYESTCVYCHTPTLTGRTGDPSELPPLSSLPDNMQKTVGAAGGKIPPFAGPAFMTPWGAKNTKDLSHRIEDAASGFPPKDLDEETYLNITAY